MEKHITEFSKETIDKIGYYVYRLVDPRNGQTFYVGKGTGNRVFAHANAVDFSFYDSDAATSVEQKMVSGQFNVVNGNDEEAYKDPAKISRIKDIKNDGLDVIHMIQMWGLTEKEAFKIESAFIGYFGLPNLTNKVRGHDFEQGMIYTDMLEKKFKAEVFDDYPNNNCPRFVLIKIRRWWIEQNGNDIYKTVRWCWNLRPERANKYPYVLAVCDGIVVGVYKIKEDGWQHCPPDISHKSYFDGEEAEESVKERFLGKKIPERYRKDQRPVYCDKR